MPNRILRAELLDSEPWLALKDNADRCAWIACVLSADTFGNMPAGPQRLVKLWRPYGIDTPEKAAKVFGDLVDVDLVRRYTDRDKPYLHIPRFNQSRRYLGHLWPLSPWTTKEEKQRLAGKSPADHSESQEVSCEPPVGVGVGVGVGVELEVPHPSPNSTTKPPRTPTPPASPDAGFAEFWAAYPKKVGKTAAAKAWGSNHPPPAAVLTALAWQTRSDQWTREAGRYIPNPATYLNQGRWEDQPAARDAGPRPFKVAL